MTSDSDYDDYEENIEYHADGNPPSPSSDVGAVVGAGSFVEPQEIDQVAESEEQVASRRSLYLIGGIILLGAIVIAIVLGVALGGNENNASAVKVPNFPMTPPTTLAPTPGPTSQPTTGAPVTPGPTTPAPITAAPTSTAPTAAPTTTAPTSSAPVTPQPITPQPVTPAPVTSAPTTLAPVFAPVPIPGPPITAAPVAPSTSVAPTFLPITLAPTTLPPTTPEPTTSAPITSPPSQLPSLAPTTPRPTSSIQAILTAVALEGGAEFNDPTSYSSKSLSWLESSSIQYDDLQLVQRYALGCIYYATFGVTNPISDEDETEWGDSEGWVTDADECTWFGVACNADGLVDELRLGNNNITGTFPNEVILLAESLTVFQIGENRVWNKDEQVEFLGELVNLVYLDIGSTYFYYNGIPPVLGNLVNLEILDIAYTIFFGPIRGPEVFSNLQKLEEIEMGGNAYNQSIPLEIARLPLLTNFYCENSYLTGNIDFIAEMPLIFELWLDYNPGLGGAIPTEIGTKFATLQSLSLVECAFTGSIPRQLGSLIFLQQLWLTDNQLKGDIPSNLGALDMLYTFDVSNNLLEGSMPDEICDSPFATGWDELCADCDLVECCCCTCCTSSSCPAN